MIVYRVPTPLANLVYTILRPCLPRLRLASHRRLRLFKVRAHSIVVLQLLSLQEGEHDLGVYTSRRNSFPQLGRTLEES